MITVASNELAANIDFDKIYPGLPKNNINIKVIKIPNCTIMTVQCIRLLNRDLSLNSLTYLMCKTQENKRTNSITYDYSQNKHNFPGYVVIVQ